MPNPTKIVRAPRQPPEAPGTLIRRTRSAPNLSRSATADSRHLRRLQRRERQLARQHPHRSWALHDEGELQALRINIGRGSVTMLNATPFGNRELLEGDHAPLFVAAHAAAPRRSDRFPFGRRAGLPAGTDVDAGCACDCPVLAAGGDRLVARGDTLRTAAPLFATSHAVRSPNRSAGRVNSHCDSAADRPCMRQWCVLCMRLPSAASPATPP